MKRFFKIGVGLAVLFSLCLPAAGILICVESTPLVKKNAELSFNHLKKVRQLIRANRPNLWDPSHKNRLQLTQDDLNLLISYALSEKLNIPGIYGRGRLGRGKVWRISRILPDSRPDIPAKSGTTSI